MPKRMVKYLGIKDVANALNLTVGRVRQLANSVGIPGAYKNSSGWQIPEDSLNEPPLSKRPKPGPKKE